jgi:GNAT superfamily N-acetyltransferase
MSGPEDGFSIRFATDRDLPLILRFVTDLAAYEELSHEVTATEAGLRATLFGPRPAAEVIIGELDGRPVGFAVFFQTFSTFLGLPGLYLEDLFVSSEWRGRGFGTRLLAHLARMALDRGWGRMEWSVLDWNETALRVYRRIGARAMEEWTVHRLTGDGLRRLAEGESLPPVPPAPPATPRPTSR